MAGYGFIRACWIRMAAGFTAAGAAIADLYRAGKSNAISGTPEGNVKQPVPGLCHGYPGFYVMEQGSPLRRSERS
jgi:hypothetical protein